MRMIEAHGATIPVLGFGTWPLRGADAVRMVAHALKVGYRHIDTAQMYENESEVGRAIASSGIDRSEIFLTTKVRTDRTGKEDLPSSVDASLSKLRLEYVDLLLLHWPTPRVPLAETIGALDAVKSAGKARHVGLSNYDPKLLTEAVALSDALLVTNQVEYHPLIDQSAVVTATRRAGMAVTAYSPLAKGRVMKERTLREIGEAHGKSAAQVALRWLIQQEGVSAIPKAGSEAHCAANFDIFDFELDESEMEAIGGLSR